MYIYKHYVVIQNMHIYMYVYIYACMYNVCVYICVYLPQLLGYVRMYNMYMCMYNVCVYIYASMFIMYVDMYLCVCIPMCIYIYIIYI